ncbi:hypothetical protein NA57DRAFT_52703 [Rhizodiscina lignyota]|uniref:DUF7702 domain-containing protein n=1 Tax=Rhizodiscina lignyota TaxID=1504668 RepID=A0A9P4INH9_9PEZI|nr:hypothetical protein NA57DRAFT_52703 [Rhizodiscina lignyota]
MASQEKQRRLHKLLAVLLSRDFQLHKVFRQVLQLDTVSNSELTSLPSTFFSTPDIIYVLIRHGRRGYSGWGFLLVYCILPVTSSSVQIGDSNTTSITGAIINSIGIYALLMALSGVIYEAATYIPNYNVKIGRTIQLVLHVLTTGGIALAAVGASNLSSDASSPDKLSKDHDNQRAGYLILFLVSIFLTANCLYTYFRLRSHDHKSLALKLVFWIFPALPFVATRIIYSITYAFSNNPSLSPVTGTFGVKFGLIFLVQLIAALCLAVGGAVSLDIPRQTRIQTDVHLEPFDRPQRV